jgi:hypothetical protein
MRQLSKTPQARRNQKQLGHTTPIHSNHYSEAIREFLFHSRCKQVLCGRAPKQHTARSDRLVNSLAIRHRGPKVLHMLQQLKKAPLSFCVQTSVINRHSRTASNPTPRAKIPTCGFPAPNSSVTHTCAEAQVFTQAPDSFQPC